MGLRGHEMKKTPILSDEQILNLWDTHVGEPCSSMPLIDADKEEFARAIEQAVLQSPQVQQWRKDAELLNIAIQMLAEWCQAVRENGTGWDDWDEHYKDACYRPGPLRALIDAAMEQNK